MGTCYFACCVTCVYSPLQLTYDYELNILHLRIFGCAIHVSIAPSQPTKMGPQFTDCHFNETIFPTLGRKIKKLEKEITWNV